MMELKPGEETNDLDHQPKIRKPAPPPIELLKKLKQKQPDSEQSAFTVNPEVAKVSTETEQVNSRRKYYFLALGFSFLVLIVVLSSTLPMLLGNQKGWGQWNTWTPCNHTCGIRLQHRNRSCSKDTACFNNNIQTSPCLNISACPSWSSWTTWGICSKTCDAGLQKRTRNCTEDQTISYGCEGPRNVTKACTGLPKCPEWGSWTRWSGCSDKTCGFVQKTRTRICKNKHASSQCHGLNKQTMNCKSKNLCPKRKNLLNKFSKT